MIHLVAMLSVSCSLTPEEKHAVLTFFFDDVPPLYAPLPEEPSQPEMRAEAPVAPARAPRARWMLHGPYSDREQCHLCHAGDFDNRLVVAAEELCWECHQREDILWGPVVHSPVQASACVGCHDPHKSTNDHLLVRPTAAICEQCHDEETFEALAEHRAEQGSECLSCHDPHASDREYMLLGDAGW
jgi:predicted CXXCH cytochrome family protein